MGNVIDFTLANWGRFGLLVVVVVGLAYLLAGVLLKFKMQKFAGKTDRVGHISKVQFDACFKMYQSICEAAGSMISHAATLGVCVANSQISFAKRKKLFAHFKADNKQLTIYRCKFAPFIDQGIYDKITDIISDSNDLVMEFDRIICANEVGAGVMRLVENLAKKQEQFISDLRQHLNSLVVM